MVDDHGPDDSREPADESWPERHLGKIVSVVLFICLLGIVARALTG